jgi:NMD protein affecting ribosome stability and mRNA decay
MAPEPLGHYLCETCFDAMTDLVIVRDGLLQACCVACQGLQLRQPWEEMPAGGWGAMRFDGASAILPLPVGDPAPRVPAILPAILPRQLPADED